jgi:hypothetical protein
VWRRDFVLIAIALAAASCGGSSSSGSPGDAGSVDASPSDARADGDPTFDASDHGAPSTTFPAFTPDFAQIVNSGGPILAAPVIVTITWPAADSQASTWEAMGDTIGASSYWSGAVGEYGVGPATSGPANHVELSGNPPQSFTDAQLEAFIAANVGQAQSDAGPPWPAPTLDAKGNSQTIYTVFVPPSMTLVDSSSMVPLCTERAGGYHNHVIVGGLPVSYAVVIECPGTPTHAPFTAVDIEQSASHEFAEASTDPFPALKPAFKGFDIAHGAWELWSAFQDELGDACESFKSSYYQETGSFPYWVQRIWSNKAAATGKNPCAPQVTEPFYDVTLFPEQKQDITVDLSALQIGKVTTKGFLAPVGQATHFQIGFFSEAATSPFSISVGLDSQLPFVDGVGNPIANGAADVVIDKTTGQNGEKAWVTVTPTTAGQLGFQLIVLTAKGASSTYPHYLPVLLANR